MKALPDRLKEVLERLPDAVALTTHVQGKWRKERGERLDAIRADAYHRYRKKWGGMHRKIPETSADAIARLRRDTRNCPYCGKRIPAGKVVIDHFIPLCKGGDHSPDNLVGCCRTCNSKKGRKTNWEPALKWKAGKVIVVDFGD